MDSFSNAVNLIIQLSILLIEVLIINKNRFAPTHFSSMNYPGHITTVDQFEEYSLKEKNSLFTGQVNHCESETEADKILKSIRKKYYDATHHCFAYNVIDEKIKYSDDGEPTGTAGVRILNAIEHFNLLNVLVVVIRYFGGTKLGVGLLGKSYYSAAYGVLEIAKKTEKTLYNEIKILSDFKDISQVHRIVANVNGIIEDFKYEEKVNFNCLIKPDEMENISKQLTTISKGQISIISTNANRYK